MTTAICRVILLSPLGTLVQFTLRWGHCAKPKPDTTSLHNRREVWLELHLSERPTFKIAIIKLLVSASLMIGLTFRQFPAC
jgi:hypothetical protein